MVEVVGGAPCHASCHDRPPGHMGDPHALSRPRSRPHHCGFPAAYWYLYPVWCSACGYYSGDQTGKWQMLGFLAVTVTVIKLLIKHPVVSHLVVMFLQHCYCCNQRKHTTLTLTHNHTAGQTWPNACFDRLLWLSECFLLAGGSVL